MAPRKAPPTAFKPGQSGNPAGRKAGIPNKVTKEIREIAQDLIGSTTYRARLQKSLDEGKCHPSVETMLWHYAYGKPKETVKVEGGLEVLRVVIEK
jgi:hypothetical protein